MSLTEERKFGLLFAGISAAVAAYLYWRASPAAPWLAGAGGVFLAAALAAPTVLKPVRRGWMALAHALAWVNTRIILSVFYYLILTPVGLVLRALGKDPLARRRDPTAHTYWITRGEEATDRKRYERLF